MTQLDILIKSTLQKFTINQSQVNLDNMAALLEMKPEVLIFKLERMIYTGYIQGKIDKKARVFIPAGILQQSSSISSQSTLPEPVHQYSEGQTEFVKARTSETSQEDFVKLEASLGYLGSHIRLVLRIINKSDYPIDEIELKLEFSKKLDIFRSAPKIEYMKHVSGILVRLPSIAQKEVYEVKFYLNPEELGRGRIRGEIKFVNYKDYVRFIKVEDLEYNLTVPTIEPKEISSDLIEVYNSSPQMKKDIRSYGLPDKLNPLTAFNHIFQIIRAKNFSLLTKNVEDTRKIAWFFGTTQDSQIDILVVAQVINNKIEFYASSVNEQILSALLTSFAIDLKRRILISNVVNSEKEIYDLFCAECGGTLPYFPKPGEFVECKYCKTKNLVR